MKTKQEPRTSKHFLHCIYLCVGNGKIHIHTNNKTCGRANCECTAMSLHRSWMESTASLSCSGSPGGAWARAGEGSDGGGQQERRRVPEADVCLKSSGNQQGGSHHTIISWDTPSLYEHSLSCEV
uniref:Uncharacterized protein n=1 Tax=Pipistrellus kuhlii TaxID=59472 RepID=A0A7J7TW26_PIPKU|nr:hypothetical protein mPipKuh1_009246 [Pipistrellus kuhlii]